MVSVYLMAGRAEGARPNVCSFSCSRFARCFTESVRARSKHLFQLARGQNLLELVEVFLFSVW